MELIGKHDEFFDALPFKNVEGISSGGVTLSINNNNSSRSRQSSV
jgi:hypothetical protein